MWSARELLFERTHSLGSTALALVWVLPRVSRVPPRMFCTLGDSTCLSRSSASPSVNEDHRCDAECDASSTDVPHPDLLILGELVEGDDKQEVSWLQCSGPGCGRA